jgi:tRNA 2-selenouridine synthase
MTWRELSVPQLINLKNVLVIDVRSPGEHEIERIPDSKNVPLLSDLERAEVGTIYKQQGEMVARRHALKLISPKIPSLVEGIVAQRQHGQALVVYCWRGGLRSESVCSVLSIAGIDCFRLTGGYKAWRGQVLKDFADDAYPFDPIVLVGLTGTGKTEILQALASKGLAVLDLEALANHRGSVFGGLGLGDQPTQKNFDAQLWLKLRQLQNATTFLEGESRKIGRLALPDCVFNRIENGKHVLITGSVARRSRRIADDYLAHNPEKETQKALQLLDHLKERLGTKVVTQLKADLSEGRVLQAVETLLVEYYDPLYRRQIERCAPFLTEVDGDDVAVAADKLASLVQAPTR